MREGDNDNLYGSNDEWLLRLDKVVGIKLSDQSDRWFIALEGGHLLETLDDMLAEKVAKYLRHKNMQPMGAK